MLKIIALLAVVVFGVSGVAFYQQRQLARQVVKVDCDIDRMVDILAKTYCGIGCYLKRMADLQEHDGK